MEVAVSVNGQPIRRLLIDNLTARPSGVNTYRWSYVRTDAGPATALLSAKQGTVEHIYEEGAMVLIGKVAEAAAKTEEEAGV